MRIGTRIGFKYCNLILYVIYVTMKLNKLHFMLNMNDILQIYLPSFCIFFAALCSFFICYSDITKYRIPNPLIIFMAISALGLLLPTESGAVILRQFGIALLFLIIGFAVFYFKVMGAGDSKLFAALGLWCYPSSIPMFLLIVAFAGLFLALLYAGIHYLKINNKLGFLRNNLYSVDILHVKIPYGVALCIGAWFLFYHSFVRLNGII